MDSTDERFAALEARAEQLDEALTATARGLESVEHNLQQLARWIGADGDPDAPFAAEFAALRATVESLVVRVEGRNKSAATKRNMTDADAIRVLTGDLQDLAHKEAGERIGLTYAQVYSARCEFTFKHVHKDLRDKKWKNPWAR